MSESTNRIVDNKLEYCNLCFSLYQQDNTGKHGPTNENVKNKKC